MPTQARTEAGPIIISDLQLQRARAVITSAFNYGDISKEERAALLVGVEPGARLVTVRSVIGDLWLVAGPNSRLATNARNFLESTPPTRGGRLLGVLR